MTYNTGNAVPSTDPRDLDDNAQAFDRFMQSAANTEKDRLGVDRLTWHYVESIASALTNPNIVGLSALTSGAGKAFRFTNTAGQMATYDLSSLGITLAGIADQAAGRAALGALGSTDNIASASKLATARTIAVTGDGTWSASFDGSSDTSSTFTLAATGVSAGTYVRVTVDTKGRVTAGQTSALGIAQGGTGQTTTAAHLVDLVAAGAYSKTSILAAVAQTGGVPTGGVFETGGNATNGKWTKYADGTMEFSRRLSVTTAISTAAGNMFYSGGIAATATGVTFVGDLPEVQISSEDAAGISWATFAGAPTLTQMPAFYLLAPTSVASRTYTVNLKAKGRWF